MKKTNKSKEERTIWLSCAIFVICMTACVIWANSRYGIAGITWSFILTMCALQVCKNIYEFYALHGDYSLKKIVKCTTCYTIYMIFNGVLVDGWLFSTIILMADDETWGIPKLVYCVVIIVLAVLLTLKPIRPFVMKEKYPWNKRYPANLISAFVPRFVILYTFVVFYFLSFANFTTTKEIIPSLCVTYIGIERLISMFDTVKEYSKQEFKSLFRDTARWVIKQRGILKRDEAM